MTFECYGAIIINSELLKKQHGRTVEKIRQEKGQSKEADQKEGRGNQRR
jgi:hypothetical protein